MSLCAASRIWTQRCVGIHRNDRRWRRCQREAFSSRTYCRLRDEIVICSPVFRRSGRGSRLKRAPQRVGRGGEQLREIVRRERHKRAVAATRRCHRLPQEIVAAAMTVTHALPLVTRHGSRRVSSKEDTGTNPSIILHITGRTKPIFQL